MSHFEASHSQKDLVDADSKCFVLNTDQSIEVAQIVISALVHIDCDPV